MATYSDGPTATSTTSGSTLAVTGITAAIGDLLVLFCSADNSGTSGVSSTSTSITDAAGNTWTSQAQTTQTGGAADDGTTLAIWTSLITATLSSATITINFSPNTTSKAAALQKAVPATGCTMVVGTIGPGVTNAASTTRTSGAVSVDLGTTMIGASAVETNSAFTADSDTVNGSWSTQLTASANTGSFGTSQTISVQRKTVTASGNQTYNTSSGAARDSALNYLLVYEKITGALTVTLGALTGTLAGRVDIAGALTGTLGALTVSATGLMGIAGSLTATLGALTPAATGAVTLPSVLAYTEAPDRAAFTLVPGWPSSLPLPTLQGFAFQPAASVERRPMEIGAPRVYRRTRRPTIDAPVTWQLDDDQQALLDGFQSSTLREGALAFGIELLLPSGLALAVATFKGKLAMRALGGTRWQTTATLELLSRPMMTDAALTALLDDAGDPPAWPTGLLPYPTLDSGELTPKPATIRSDDRPGLPHARQRSRNSTADVPAAWELSAYQAAIFDAFFHWRGLDGAQWFSFPLVQAIGTVDTMVRFLGEADWTPRGAGRWGVSAPLEIRERRIMTEAEVRNA